MRRYEDANDVETLLNRFPGPLTISVSVSKYLVALAGCCIFVAGEIPIIRSPEAVAAKIHGRGAGLLHLLVFSHVARDMPQAVVEFGWVSVALFGLGGLAFILMLVLRLTGSWGLTLDDEGFTVSALKGNKRHCWQDVGDFDNLALSKTTRRRYAMLFLKSCVIFNDYLAPQSPIKWLQLTGRNRALMESYVYSAEDLAVAMSAWRKRALENPRETDR